MNDEIARNGQEILHFLQVTLEIALMCVHPGGLHRSCVGVS